MQGRLSTRKWLLIIGVVVAVIIAYTFWESQPMLFPHRTAHADLRETVLPALASVLKKTLVAVGLY